MIAADTSSLSAYLKGDAGADVEKLATALAAGELVLPPVVVTELLSDPGAAKALDSYLPDVAMLELKEGYWARADTRSVFSSNKE